MSSPSQKSRQGQRSESKPRSQKLPLSPTNADQVKTDAVESKTLPMKDMASRPHSPTRDMHSRSPVMTHQNSENQILSSVALLIDSLKFDSSHQQSGSMADEADDSNLPALQQPETIQIDNVSPLASPAVSPTSQYNNTNMAKPPTAPSRPLDAQTLQNVAKFVEMLQTNIKTAPVGQELDQIVKSMSEESLDCAAAAPKVTLSPETIEALGLFIDHLSKNEARKRESMPPTQVYVPTKLDQPSADIVDATPVLAADVQSVQTQDLDPEALDILGRYIDAVAATPRSALSHWGIDPPSLRRGESEIVFQAPSQETAADDEDDNDERTKPSPAAASTHMPQLALAALELTDNAVFTFDSIEESVPRAPPSMKSNMDAGNTPQLVSSTRARQDPGGAHAHVVGTTVEQHRHAAEDDLLPALAWLHLSSGATNHLSPRDAPTDALSQADDAKQDPPPLSPTSNKVCRSPGKPEINFNRLYWTEEELKLRKLKMKPESPRKKSTRNAVMDHTVCPDPVLHACGLKMDFSGEQNNRQDDKMASTVEDLVSAMAPMEVDAVGDCVGDSKFASWTDEVIDSIEASSSLLTDCGGPIVAEEMSKIQNTLQCQTARDEAATLQSSNYFSPVISGDRHVDNQQNISALKHHVSWEDEKKADQDVDSKDCLQREESSMLLGKLYKFLTDHAHPTLQELDNFRMLVRVSLPYYINGRQPTAVERARIQVQARRKHVPIVLTNAFLESLQTLSESEKALGMQQTETIDATELQAHNDEKMVSLLHRLLAVKQAESNRDVVIYSLAGVGSQEGEAVEVDLHGHFGFAKKDYGEVEEVLSDGEPWWEAAARLVRQSKKQDDVGPRTPRSLDPPPASLDSSSEDDSTYGESSTKKPVSIEDDIQGFWRERKRRSRRKYGRATNSRRWQVNEQWTTSYSATDYESSLRSKSSSSSGFTGASNASVASLEDEWVRKRSYALWPKKYANKLQVWMNGNCRTDIAVDEPTPINAVDSVRILDRPKVLRLWRPNAPGTKQWKRTYTVRTQAHPGYFDVDVNSLYTYSSCRGHPHRLDGIPWERREVRQRFLFEQSISYNRNWFGVAQKIYGNDTVIEPVCCPRSMEMPTKAEEWTEEWYAKPVPTILSQSTADSKDAEEMAEIRRKYLVEDEFDAEPETSQWEENPECGKIRNVKQKIGERVSRVTPELTSSLRRSRWRKKYFPKGTFPY